MALQEVHTGFTFNFDGSKLAAIQRGVGRASTNLNTVAAKTEAFTQRMGGFVERAKQVVGVYLGFRAVKLITSDYANAADAIAKFSSGLGISTQEYQRLTHAAQLNGLTIEELNMALPKLAKSAGDAADGSKSMAKAFRRAGVSVKDTQGHIKDPIRLLTEMAEGMKNVEDKGRKTQILMNIFGRAGKKMGVLLDQGSEGIKKMMLEADKLGVVMSKKQLKAAEKFKDEMLRLKAVLTGVRNIIAAKILPTMSKAIESFRKWWIEGNNAERALRALKLVAIFTGIVIARLIGASVLRNIKLFVQGIWAGVQALRAMGVAGAATAIKVWAIVAAFALLALAVEDIIGFAQGKDSIIGRLLGDTSVAKNLKAALIDLGKAVVDAWKEIGPALSDAWKSVKPAVGELYTAIQPLMGPAFRAVIKLATFNIGVMAFAVRSLAKAMAFMIGVFKGMIQPARAVFAVMATILKAIMGIESAAKTAAAALAAVTGRGKVGTALDVGAKAAAKVGKGLRLSAMPPSAPGGLQPAMALGFAGGASPASLGSPFAAMPATPSQPINTTVEPGAVSVTVNASGDPAAIAGQVTKQVQGAVGAIFTSASRDLKKPPRGQS